MYVAETKTGIKATGEREGILVDLFGGERTATKEGFEMQLYTLKLF